MPKLGTLVSVEWVDITSTVNGLMEEARPAPCTTTGRLVKKTAEFIVVGTSIFTEPGEQLCGDFVAIPVGVLGKVTRI